MNCLSTLFFILISFGYQRQSPVNPAPPIVPGLQEWKGGHGYYSPGPGSAIVVPAGTGDSLLEIARILRADLRQWMPQLAFPVRAGLPGPGDIYLGIQPGDTVLGEEGYLLEAHEDGLRITANRSRGVFWGSRSLLQAMEQDSQHRRFPCGTARDWPRYAVRGFVLDDGRKFFSLEFLRQYVKMMAYYKMNDFHLHLNDNGFRQYFGNRWDSTYAAFRLQSDYYPSLTAKDGSYSKQEFRDLQAFARSYGVNIVPEIDVPAHSLSFTHMRPEIGSKKYGMDHLDLDNPVTYRVIDSVFMEYLGGPDPVFSGPEVHIGTDEYAKESSEQFRAFTDHYIRLAEQYHKKVRMWGSLTYAQGQTPVKAKGVTMNIWYNGYADPMEMKRLGYDLLSTPDGWLYIVPAAGYYNDYPDLPNIFDHWEPVQVGDVRFPAGDPQLKGGSFAVWNDVVGNGITAKDVNDRVFPAMQVLAQKMWRGTDSALSYKDFAARAVGLGESPGSNMRAKYPSKDSVVMQYDFHSKKLSHATTSRTAFTKTGLRLQGGQSYFRTAIPEIGYSYKVMFTIRPDRDNRPNAVLFSSPDAVFKLQQQGSGKLGFSREGYDYYFDYTVPLEKWTKLSVLGDNQGTALYADGTFIQRLQTMKLPVHNGKDSIRKVQTLFFPLQYIGDTAHAFKGYIRDLKVVDLPGMQE